MCKTPNQMLEEAAAIASQLVGMPKEQLETELKKIDAKNRVTAIMVKQKLKDLAGETDV
jgi:hypothetical protein